MSMEKHFAANLAAGLALRGYRVGLLDCDIHGPTIPTIFGLESQTPDVNEEGILSNSSTSQSFVDVCRIFARRSRLSYNLRGPAKMGAIKQFLEEVNWGALDFLIMTCPCTGENP